MYSLSRYVERLTPRFGTAILVAALYSTSLYAAPPGDQPNSDKDTLQLLMKRIDQLEARVRELEADKRAATPPAAPAAESNLPTVAASVPAPELNNSAVEESLRAQTNPPASAEPEPAQSDNFTTERLDLSRTLLRIRGFGDVSLHGDTMKDTSSTADVTTTNTTTPFSLGQLDLFVTSDISDKFKVFADILFEGGPYKFYSPNSTNQNTLDVDVERYLLQYSHNDYLNISAGREHVAIGYYSTAYQHSTWLQTATGRPFLYEFEDRGGILPIHMVGISASGQIPSGSLGLHYVAEAGNGRSSRNWLTDTYTENPIDDEDHIAFNFAGFARPDAIPGLQTGFSVYRDVLRQSWGPKIGETIMAAHAILIRPKYEWLNEALLDRQALAGTSTVYNTPGFYSQFSRQFGAYRPYFRYQYVNASNHNPVFPDVALRHGPSAGLRYDASESVALKLQYDYTFQRAASGVNGLTGQVDFTF